MTIDLKNIPVKKNMKEKSVGKSGSLFMDFLNKDIRLFGTKLKDKNKERFYSDMNILLSSGIDIKTTLELIAAEQRKESDKLLFTRVKDHVIGGVNLSEALKNSGKFSTYEYYSIRIGEESGKLNHVLNELTIFFAKKIKQRRQFVNAFSYPVLVLITAIAAVIFMMNFIVPMFVDVFKRFHGNLPAITKFIINVSAFLSKYTGIIFFGLIVTVIFFYLQRNESWFRNYSSKCLLKLPLFGKIINRIYIARFCQAMALLIGSKTPMLQSIELVKKMIGFFPFEKALETIEHDILHGLSLHESMSRFKIFDNRLVSLIKVAEEVNQLDTVFAKLNKQYSEELEHQISIISSLLEPVMIIFVGILVAVILVAMYLPLFQLSTSVY